MSFGYCCNINFEDAVFLGFSPDASLLLFAVERQPVWRHSFTARYLVFDPAANTSQTVRAGSEERLQYCAWLEGTNTGLVVVAANNLYRAPVWPGTVAQLTEDGMPGAVFNGIPDWVYEEEVLSGKQATLS